MSGTVMGQESGRQERVYHDIQRIPPQATGLVSVPIDDWDYAGLPNDLSQLRVIDADFKQRPFILRSQLESSRTSSLINPTAPGAFEWSVPSWKEDVQPQGEFSALFMLCSDDPTPDRLVIQPITHDFEKRLRVYGIGEDGSETLVGDSFIYDYTSLNTTHELSVPLQLTACRLFRIVVSEPLDTDELVLSQLPKDEQSSEEQPFGVKEIRLSRKATSQEASNVATVSYRVTVEKRTDDDAEGKTYLRLNAGKSPISRLTLVTGNQDFNGTVHVKAVDTYQGRNGIVIGDSVVVGDFTVASFSVEPLREARLSLDFDLRRAAYYDFVIENGDFGPLEVASVAAYGQRHELIFLKSAESEELYVQVAGPTEAVGDISTVQTVLDRGDPLVIGRLSRLRNYDGIPRPSLPLSYRLRRILEFVFAGAFILFVCALPWIGLVCFRKWHQWRNRSQHP